ncbi:MAG: hypothetical protein IME93_00735 [Proteobacteria bacterium]|nr:hypothetical protein [Pseudomonadota bacterium]
MRAPGLVSAGLIGLLLTSLPAFASHSVGGLDLCALYPEVMPPGMPTKYIPDADSAGARLVQGYCAQCHNLPGPGRYTAEQWPDELDKMHTLMDVSSRFGGLLGNIKTPSAKERGLISDYLRQHALKSLPDNKQATAMPAYKYYCGSCHSLPDPAQYSAGQWLQIIKRMQRNMRIMKFDAPSADSLMQIQVYIQSRANQTQQVASQRSIDTAWSNEPLQASVLPLRGGSLLALGPFLLLAILGFIRWRLSLNKDNKGHD